MADNTIAPPDGQGGGDNVRRGFRTGLQAAAGFLVAVPVIDVWNNYVTNHEVHDPTLKFAVGVILAAIVAWAHNAIADKSGVDVLSPIDRRAGDAVIGDGLGAKTGEIIGDAAPNTTTRYVETK